MATTRVNGIDVYYELHGDRDAPWVLNIGGTGGDLRETFPRLSPLNDHFHVIHYDQRGLGRTSRPDSDYSMAQYADDAAALIERLVPTTGGGRCHVVGTSFGGMVALNLAVRHPASIDRLVLIVTSPGGEHASYRLTDLDAMPPEERVRTRMRLFDNRWDPDADTPIPDLGRLYDVILARLHQTPSPEVAAGLARQLVARDGHDVIDKLARIPHPTLVACGRYDDLAPVANSEVLAAHLPNARLRVFEGGHFVPFQDPRLWPAVIDFLS